MATFDKKQLNHYPHLLKNLNCLFLSKSSVSKYGTNA